MRIVLTGLIALGMFQTSLAQTLDPVVPRPVDQKQPLFVLYENSNGKFVIAEVLVTNDGTLTVRPCGSSETQLLDISKVLDYNVKSCEGLPGSTLNK